jgi:hypothetical protein
LARADGAEYRLSAGVPWLPVEPDPAPPASRRLNCIYVWRTDRGTVSTEHLFFWMNRFGTAVDLTTLIFALVLLAARAATAKPWALSVVGAMFLCCLRIWDWSAADRLVGPFSLLGYLDRERTPVHLVGDWIDGRRNVREALALVGFKGACEILALTLVLCYLVVVSERRTRSEPKATPAVERMTQRRSPES